jgi:hypothetical protein
MIEMKKFEYKLDVRKQLSVINLYELGIPTSTIGRLYKVNYVTILNILKRFERLNLTKVRSRSDTVLLTLSKQHTEPKGCINQYVNEWIRQFGIDGIKDLLTVILITDGHSSYKHKIVSLTNSDKILLGIFVDMLRELKLDPRQSYDRRNDLPIIFARSNKVKNILNEIRTITPVTKHQPARGKQTWEEFLREGQPTLSFLLSRPRELRQLAFRLAMSFEGCVVVDVTSKRLTRPFLQFTCFHPNLIQEWKNIAESIGIYMSHKRNILTTASLCSVIEFLDIGGFLEGVVNSKKSKYFTGIEKNKVLLGILEYCYMEREHIIPMIKSSKQINKAVRKIVEKKQLKDPEFYIQYFSDIFQEYHGLKTKEAILKVLESKPQTIKEIISKTKFKEQRIRPMLTNLINEGIVKRVKKGTYSFNK